MAISTSTNNISPNSSESFYVDSPSPPLYGHFFAFSLRETIRHRATQQCYDQQTSRGGGGGGEVD